MSTSALLSNSGCSLLPSDSQMFPSFLSAHSLIVLPSSHYRRYEKENDFLLVLLYNWYIVAVYPYFDLNLMSFWWLKPKGFTQSSAKEASSCTPYPSTLRQSSAFVDYTHTLGWHPSPCQLRTFGGQNLHSWTAITGTSAMILERFWHAIYW